MEPDLFQEYCRLFALAEQKVKLIELLEDELSIPAVNELRYAGSHCARALLAPAADKRAELILESEKHCRRAIYDALEIGLAHRLRGIDEFLEDYRLVPISPVVSTFNEDLAAIQQIRDSIAGRNRHDVETDDEWQLMQQQFDRLTEIQSRFEAARGELRKGLNLWRISIIVSLLALAVSMAALALQIAAHR